MTKHDLVPVFTGTIAGQPTQLCNARDLHGFLAVGRDFSTWVKSRISEYRFVEGEDYSPVLVNRSGATSGKPRIDYHLTLDMAKELAMIENNEQGRKARRYFIACEKALSAPSTVVVVAPIPAKPPIKTRDDLSFTRRDSKGRLINWSVENDHNELWGEAAKIGQGFMDEIAELASHDEVAAYWAVLFAISGQEFKRGPSTHFTNLGWGREFGFAEAIARAVIDGLRARGNSNYEPFDPDAPKKKGGKKSLPRAKGSAALPPPSLPSAKLSIALH